MRQNQIEKLHSDSKHLLPYIEQIEKLHSDSKHLLPYIEQIEKQMQALDDESRADKELRHLARLLYVGQIVERSGLLYSLNEHAFCQFLTENKNTLQKPIVK